MKASLLTLSLILLAVLGACSDEGPVEAGSGESREVEEVVTSIPFTDPTARLIVDESGDLESRLDAIDAIGKGASRQLVDALLRVMKDRRRGAVIICRDGVLAGIFTERDVLTRVVAAGLSPDDTMLDKVMTKNPDTVTPGEAAIDALERMRTQGYRHLPVVEDGKLVGIVSIRDLYAAVKTELESDLKHHEAFIFDTGYGGN